MSYAIYNVRIRVYIYIYNVDFILESGVYTTSVQSQRLIKNVVKSAVLVEAHCGLW